MSRKCNVRSFRYSDEVSAILHGFGSPNSSLNDRFEKLILHCNLELPSIDKKIESRRNELKKLEDEYRTMLKKVSDMRAVGRELDSMMVEYGRLKKRLSELVEKV